VSEMCCLDWASGAIWCAQENDDIDYVGPFHVQEDLPWVRDEMLIRPR
jgi:hypothetical protein